MAFNALGTTADAADVQQILDALQGVSGAGQPIALTQLSDASNYALDVRNLDTTNGYGLRVRDGASSNLLLVYKNTITLGASAANDALTINCNIAGKVYIGDSANGKMTTGLTINQAGADDEILDFKSSDVAHGITDDAETDTYGFARKFAAAGGLQIVGLQGGAGTNSSLFLVGEQATAADTTKSTAAAGVVRVGAYIKSGTGSTVVGADGNLFTIHNGASTCRFIFDAEGSAHGDVEFVAFDDFDDVALLDTLTAEFVRRKDPVKAEFGEWMQEHKASLQREGIVNFYDETGKRAMVNFSKLSMLQTGAIRQVSRQLNTALVRLATMEQRFASLPGGN